MTTAMIIALSAFIIIYFFVATELINKTTIVLLGGMSFIIAGLIDQENAFKVIDWNVIFLLIGMMIIVGITKKTGVFQYVAIKAAKLAKGDPVVILILLSVITALFSAFLDNVTTVMLVVPVTILIAVELGITPVPYIIAEAISSNVGGTATLIGDPPNIMIGSAAQLTFIDFILNMAPVIVLVLLVLAFLEFIFFRKKLNVSNERKARIMEFDESRSIEDKILLVKSLSVLFAVIGGFLLHGYLKVEASTIALFGAAFLMLISGSGKEGIEEFLKEVEWGTIFFFIGLFIIIGGIVEQGVIGLLAKNVIAFTNGDVQNTSLIMIWAAGIFSSFMDNIPFVATMIPMVQEIGTGLDKSSIAPLWWSLALGACLGGNGTLIGASANVVSAGLSGKSGYKISFMEFTKYGAIFTLVSLSISTLYIWLRYFVFKF